MKKKLSTPQLKSPKNVQSNAVIHEQEKKFMRNGRRKKSEIFWENLGGIGFFFTLVSEEKKMHKEEGKILSFSFL